MCNKIEKNLKIKKEKVQNKKMLMEKNLIQGNTRFVKVLRKKKDQVGLKLVVQKILYLFWRRVGYERGFFFEDIRKLSLNILKNLCNLCVKKVDEINFNLIRCLLEFFCQVNCHIERERSKLIYIISKQFLKEMLLVRKYIYDAKVASFSNYEFFSHKFRFLSDAIARNKERKKGIRLSF